MLYREATEKELLQIARINIECVPNGLRAALGEKLTEQYFSRFYAEKAPLLVADSGGGLAGYGMGYYKGSMAKRSFEAQYADELAARLAQMSSRGNQAALRCLRQKAKAHGGQASVELPESRYDAVLFSLSVLPRYRQNGIGKAIVLRFTELVERSGKAGAVCVQTQRDNLAARQIYEACGYRLFAQTADAVWYERIL